MSTCDCTLSERYANLCEHGNNMSDEEKVSYGSERKLKPHTKILLRSGKVITVKHTIDEVMNILDTAHMGNENLNPLYFRVQMKADEGGIITVYLRSIEALKESDI